MRGVRSVINEIEVGTGDERGDDELRREIEGALRWDAYPSQADVRVRVTEGSAKLSGLVCSLSDRVLAAKNAWVSGISSVDVSDLEITDCSSSGELTRTLRTAPPTDDEIMRAIEAALNSDPRMVSGNHRGGGRARTGGFP